MKEYVMGAAIVPLSVAVVALGISQLGLINVAAVNPDPTPVKWFLHTTYEKSVRRAADEIDPPTGWNSEANVLKGAKNFAAMCAGCHTPPGMLPTATSQGLNPPPPRANLLAAERTVEERFWVISNGVKMTGMPAFGPSHSDKNDLWAMVAFTEELPGLSASAYKKAVEKGRSLETGSDGHAHSHAGDAGHSDPGTGSGHHDMTEKPTDDNHAGHAH